MTILVAKASKPRADSKLGFTYSTPNGRTIVTTVDPAGLFGSSGLRAGQFLLTINGSCAEGIGGPGLRAILTSLGAGEVTIVAENPPGEDDTAVFEYTLGTEPHVVKAHGKMMTKACPQILVDAGVPPETWSIVHALIVGRLMPASLKCVEKSALYASLKPFSLSGKRNHDDIVIQSIGMEVLATYHNANMAAAATVHKVNALLGKYGVAAVLECKPFEWMNKDVVMIPTGFSFHRMG